MENRKKPMEEELENRKKIDDAIYYYSCNKQGCHDEELLDSTQHVGRGKVNLQDLFGDTCIHRMILKNRYDCVKYLIDNGADVNIENDVSATPLMLTLYTNNIDIAKLLIDNGADFSKLKVCKIEAAKSLSQEFIELLEKYNMILLPSMEQELLEAAKSYDNKRVDELLQQGADVNVLKKYVNTLLEESNPEYVKELVDMGIHYVEDKTWKLLSEQKPEGGLVMTQDKDGVERVLNSIEVQNAKEIVKWYYIT